MNQFTRGTNFFLLSLSLHAEFMNWKLPKIKKTQRTVIKDSYFYSIVNRQTYFDSNCQCLEKDLIKFPFLIIALLETYTQTSNNNLFQFHRVVPSRTWTPKLVDRTEQSMPHNQLEPTKLRPVASLTELWMWFTSCHLHSYSKGFVRWLHWNN